MEKFFTPRVSVVCAWYQRSDVIEKTIDSILSQSIVDFELVIVNDGSPDPEVTMKLEAYSKNEKVLIVSQKNQGFVSAITNAIKSARGEYIAIQGAGDYSHPDRLKEQLDLIGSDERVGVVGCGYETIVERDGELFPINNIPSKESFGLDDVVRGGLGVTHGSLMFRRSAFEAVGGYRSVFKYGQDRDLLIRLGEKGYIGKNVMKPLYRRWAFESDGVSANKRKLLIQQALVSFSLQCKADRDSVGYDCVEVYGNDALLFRKPSKKLAIYSAKLGLISLLVEDYVLAEEFLHVSLRERFTLWGGGLYLLYKVLWKVKPAKQAIKLFASRHPRYASWISKR